MIILAIKNMTCTCTSKIKQQCLKEIFFIYLLVMVSIARAPPHRPVSAVECGRWSFTDPKRWNSCSHNTLIQLWLADVAIVFHTGMFLLKPNFFTPLPAVSHPCTSYVLPYCVANFHLNEVMSRCLVCICCGISH